MIDEDIEQAAKLVQQIGNDELQLKYFNGFTKETILMELNRAKAGECWLAFVNGHIAVWEKDSPYSSPLMAKILSGQKIMHWCDNRRSKIEELAKKIGDCENGI